MCIDGKPDYTTKEYFEGVLVILLKINFKRNINHCYFFFLFLNFLASKCSKLFFLFIPILASVY